MESPIAMRHCDLLVTHGLVVDAHDGVREDFALAVEGNRLIGVGPSKELASEYRAERTLDASDKAILPGLINAHTHASATLFRGYASDVSGKGFFDRMWRIEALLTDEDVYVGALAGCLAAMGTALVALVVLTNLPLREDNLYMAYFNLGNKLRSLQEWDRAVDSYAKSLDSGEATLVGVNDFVTDSTRTRGDPSRCAGICRSRSGDALAAGASCDAAEASGGTSSDATFDSVPRACAGPPPPGSGERQPP